MFEAVQASCAVKKSIQNFQNVCSLLFQMKMPSHKDYKSHFNTNFKHYAYMYFFCFAFPTEYCFQNLVLPYAGEQLELLTSRISSQLRMPAREQSASALPSIVQRRSSREDANLRPSSKSLSIFNRLTRTEKTTVYFCA